MAAIPGIEIEPVGTRQVRLTLGPVEAVVGQGHGQVKIELPRRAWFTAYWGRYDAVPDDEAVDVPTDTAKGDE